MTNFTATQGDTISLSTKITREDPDTSEVNPVDITSADLWFTAKYNLSDDDANALIQLGTRSPLTGIDKSATPTDGKATVTIPASATKGLSDQTVFLFWDIELEEADGTVTTVDSGRLALVNDATKAS
jgi:hypothetical protein